MIKMPFPAVFAIMGLGLLSGCGGAGGEDNPLAGGGTGTGTEPPSPSPTVYYTLDSKAKATSILGGVSLRSNGATGALTLAGTSGTLTHNSGALTLSDGLFNFDDADGFDQSGTMHDGSATLTARPAAGNFDYVAAYDQTYSAGGTVYDSIGIYGVATNAADVPKSGSATYRGEAGGFAINADQGLDLTDGTSTVTAYFGANTVNVTLGNFTAMDQATGAQVTAPFDKIEAKGMTISGNSFSGGTFSTTLSGAAVNFTGAGTSSVGNGAFFGYDTGKSTPDEVGGLILMQGQDGMISAHFLAD